MKILFCGDVMTGRGIDQILPHPSHPLLFEKYSRDARDFIRLAEEVNGPIAFPVDYSYPWGESLSEIAIQRPDVRIINLETCVTQHSVPWKDKPIHFRMHPRNAPCLTAAQIDVCSLANNHSLDWGYAGLAETIATLRYFGIAPVGAGASPEEASTPAIVEVAGDGRALVFGFSCADSGIPEDWCTSQGLPGISLLPDLKSETVQKISRQINEIRQTNDFVVASIHWGPNWGYWISKEARQFCHTLIDEGCVDIIHGHSSHHVKGIEVYNGKLILYGCGDLITDYEGFPPFERFRSDLGLMYFADVDTASGTLLSLQMLPLKKRLFSLHRANNKDTAWLYETLNREGSKMGTWVDWNGRVLSLRWTS